VEKSRNVIQLPALALARTALAPKAPVPSAPALNMSQTVTINVTIPFHFYNNFNHSKSEEKIAQPLCQSLIVLKSWLGI
jgi:hypothetical protein